MSYVTDRKGWKEESWKEEKQQQQQQQQKNKQNKQKHTHKKLCSECSKYDGDDFDDGDGGDTDDTRIEKVFLLVCLDDRLYKYFHLQKNNWKFRQWERWWRVEDVAMDTELNASWFTSFCRQKA